MQITRVTSEALQATIRRLLPSQQGFGEDLQATNVITPIIDLTPTAEGSSVPQNLQTAFGFTDTNNFGAINTTVTVANTAGFHRIIGTISCIGTAATTTEASLRLLQGVGVKKFYAVELPTGSTASAITIPFDLVVFLTSGDSITANATSARASIQGSARQIADVNGNLTNPSDFSPQ